VISSDKLSLQTGNISLAGSALSVAAHKVGIPFADVIEAGAEFYEHHKQVEESTEFDKELSILLEELYKDKDFIEKEEYRPYLKAGTTYDQARWEEIMKVVAKFQLDVFLAQINEMKFQYVKELHQLNTKKIFAAITPEKLKAWHDTYKADKKNSLDFIQYLVLSAINEDVKNTIVPGMRDSYKTENDSKKKMTFQGMCENIAIAREKKGKIKIYAAVSSLGRYDSNKDDAQINSDLSNQPKINKYGLSSSSFFNDKKVRKAIHRKRLYLKDGKNGTTGFKKEGSKDKSILFQPHIDKSLKQKIPSTANVIVEQHLQNEAQKRFGKAG
jgi:hypothetical protein